MVKIVFSVALPVDVAERLDHLHALERLERPDAPRSSVLRRVVRAGLDAVEAAEAVNLGSPN